ncbi:SusC/RagA family TonB-linked outer membrane protein [Bacteroidia bacterium]|nr:SusC/RagA family TonB-linked outer membrane protein [Bacteroidia bacterium]
MRNVRAETAQEAPQEAAQIIEVAIPSSGTKTITGFVYDETGDGVPGSTITIKGSSRGVVTDIDGSFKIDVSPTDVLEVSFLGYDLYSETVGNKASFEITLKPKANELDEVTVVAFGKQKKESVVASITTIAAKDLQIAGSNLTTAFAGKIPGLISYQTTGEPGKDNAQFFVRGVTTFGYKKEPLILIDGFESSTDDLARLQPDDIDQFSILKDASATVLYGARGANGIITITTKSGRESDKVKISARLDVNVSTPTQMLELLDGVRYMELYNEAQLSRHYDSGATTPIAQWYSQDKIEATRRGDNPMAYPNVNWYDMIMKTQTVNEKANVNLEGGNQSTTYYVAVGMDHETGLLKVDEQDNLNDFNSNIDILRFNLRSNVIFKLSKTTTLDTRISGRFQKYNGPATSASDIFKQIMDINPVEFPAVWHPGAGYENVRHTMFGAVTPAKINPFAEMVKGYSQTDESNISAQATLRHTMDYLLQNLKFEFKASISAFSSATQTRTFDPTYYSLEGYDEVADTYSLFNTNPNNNPYLGDVVGGKDGNTHYYFEARFNWGRQFGVHNIGLMTVGIAEEKLLTSGTDGNIKLTLPERNLGNSSRLTYDYDSRYFLEASYGFNGSEKFDKSHRFGFFPAVAVGWVISNEKFYSDALRDILSMAKLKYSWGKVGNDAIGNTGTRDDRFYYLSEIEIAKATDVATHYSPFYVGQDMRTIYGGYRVGQYENPFVTWEVSTKQNIGVELDLLKGMNIQVDYFTDVRDQIYWPRQNVPASLGLGGTAVSANIGKVESEGVDGSIDYKHSFNKDFWLTGRANYTFARSKVLKTDEPMNLPSYRLQVGQPVNQPFGYVAERLFLDQYEIDNSPKQDALGPTMRGDIKYTDINNDGVINENDQIPIGYPTVPQVQYGFGLSAGFKDADLSFFFQGNAQSSFFIAPQEIAPLKDRRNAPAIVANSTWSEMNPDIHAFWPRLSIDNVDNNYVNSTWWLRDASFLRLKTVELGYSISQLKGYGIQNIRLYLSGENLLTFSKFKLWDPEMGGNGLAYPINRRYNIGLQLAF